MSDSLTFRDYRPDLNDKEAIYSIGRSSEHPVGVAHEIAAAFEYELGVTPSAENLGGLIEKTGKAKELQQNIPQVQEVLGTSEDAIAITRGWAERSGLLLPVEQSYFKHEYRDEPFDLGIITGGVRNWISRRADRLIELNEKIGVSQVLLAAGNRPMATSEGPDVEEGMTETNYMELVIGERLAGAGIDTSFVGVSSGSGDEIMKVAAKEASYLVEPKLGHIAVISNAGAWVQNVGQFRRALIELVPSFDLEVSQLFAISDTIPLGTGSESTATHQNPFTAVAIIARGLQELVRQKP